MSIFNFSDVVVFVTMILVGLLGFLVLYALISGIFFPPKREPKLKKIEAVSAIDSGVRKLIREGRKDEALQAYQNFTDLSEDDARIELERLEWEEKPNMREIQLLDVVALSEDIPEENALRGQVGTVVEVLAPDVFEVEFVNREGYTYAMLTLRADQLLLRYQAAHQA